MSDSTPPSPEPNDREQRIRLLEARLHAQERALADQRKWMIAVVVIAVCYGLFIVLTRGLRW